MKTATTTICLVLALALSACVEAGVDSPVVAVTGGDLTGATAMNCRAAIAQETNLSVRDVAVFDVATSEAGNMVQATVAGADAPWICRTDSDNRVLQVIYSGSEGSL